MGERKQEKEPLRGRHGGRGEGQQGKCAINRYFSYYTVCKPSFVIFVNY